jgi:hypothetical protein
MSRLKKKYSNGQSRGGTSPNATDTGCPEGRHKKDYHRQAVQFHGSEQAYEAFVEGGRKGYYKKE